MTSGSHRFVETRQHRLRLLAIAGALGLICAVAGAVVTLALSRGGIESAVAAAAGALLAVGVFGLGGLAPRLAHLLLGDRARHRLIAAASPLHPLLRRLMNEAPGTYVHSVAVANLSEAAAEAIGADPLLARVAAYYHDVGKLSRPCYFYENSEGEFNPHDDEHPSMSADIITAHVDDGLALAQQYALPPQVFDVIREHHGTSLVRYFYDKAKGQDAAVFESDYRYRGRVPTSKESAAVMLADASEASVRAMVHPDRERIEMSVRAVVADRRADGQMDASGVTDEEFELIVGALVRNLASFRHVRCKYPYEEPSECELCR